MFNFTTQSVYNFISTTGANKNMWIANGKKPALRIGNTRFDAADILDIQVKDPTPESLACVEFDMSKILIAQDSEEKELTARIVLYIGLSMNSQDSFYANDFVYKGKPLFVEFGVKKGDTAAAVANRVKAIADKYFLFQTEEKILTISATGGKVKFTGVNGYQQFKKAILQKFDNEAITVDCCSTQGDFVDVIVGVPVMYTAEDGVVTLEETKFGEGGTPEALADNEVAIAPGLEAFGDYNWIIHNLRLPTAANTGFWSRNKEEMPVPGTVYTQFIIRICKERDGIMGEIVGARGKSVTTHVLYVAGKKDEATSPAGLVYAQLQALGTIKTDADDKLENPFA